MLWKPKSAWLKAFSVIVVMLAVDRAIGDDEAERTLDRIVENWRWTHYWSGKTGLDDVYTVGKKISALIFWTKSKRHPTRGLCSAELSLCVAYSGFYLDPSERRMSIAPDVAPQQAFASFVNNGFRDSLHALPIGDLSPADFEFEKTSVTLPALEPPSSISRRTVPELALREAERVKQLFGCWGAEIDTRPPGCNGTLVFAYYGSTEPYWYVLRTCSTACEFKGDAVEELARGDWGWEVRSAGFIGSPKAEVERLKQQIEKAEMFRLKL